MAVERFPLEQWFDLSKRIERGDLETVSDQMRLYAYKEGLDPDGAEFRAEDLKLRRAVSAHNRSFG